MKKFYITTAIDYANGSPHLGHAYEKVLADVVARFQRLQGLDVHFLTGLDEHGMKVQQSAEKKGVPPQQFVDEIAVEFQDLLKRLNISNDDYIRTTEERHKVVVQNLLQKLYEQGDIYKDFYQGFYSIRAEQFVLEKEKVDDKWPDIYGEVVEITEPNYFFRLGKYQDWLIGHIKANEDYIYPKSRTNQVLEFLKEPINDLCLSRPRERLSWGIPLPFDDEYVTYVWFDAVTNYLSAVAPGTDKYDTYWPADRHVIGKDILVPPHSVYWPIMLKAAGYEPPGGFLVHGFWTTSGSKISKSEGETIDPLDLIEEFGADAFRYYVTREMNVGLDSDFTLEKFMARYNSDLANDLGNLLSRLLNMTHRYCEGVVPAVSVREEPETLLQESWKSVKGEVVGLFEGFRFHTALERIFQFISSVNRYAETRAPWKLAKSDSVEDRQRLETALACMAESLRLAAAVLTPVMPEVSENINSLLGNPVVNSWEGNLDWSERLKGNTLGKAAILFPKTRR